MLAASASAAALPGPGVGGAISPAKLATRAASLLLSTDCQAASRWEELDEAGLSQEIEQYRACITDVARVLEGLGVSISSEHEEAVEGAEAKAAAIPGVEVCPGNFSPYADRIRV